MTQENKNGSPVFYELKTTGGLAISPWCWRARMAIAHKGVMPEIIRCGFTGKDAIEKHGGRTYPLMVAEDGAVFDDSAKIINHMESHIAEPTLFPGGDAGHAFHALVHQHIQTEIYPLIIKLIIADVAELLDGNDREYFTTTREKRFGMPLDKICPDPAPVLEALSKNLEPYRAAIAATKNGFVNGNAPAIADYMLFGMLQWARIASPKKLLGDDDALAAWMEKMLDLYDGLGRSMPARAA